MKAFEAAAPSPTCDSCFLGRAATRRYPWILERERGERHENMCVTMLELGHLNL